MMYRNNKDKEQDIKSEKAKNTLAEFVKDKEQDIKSEKAKNTLAEFVVKFNSFEFLSFARNSISSTF